MADKYDDCSKCFDDKDLEIVNGGLVNKEGNTIGSKHGEKVSKLEVYSDSNK